MTIACAVTSEGGTTPSSSRVDRGNAYVIGAGPSIDWAAVKPPGVPSGSASAAANAPRVLRKCRARRIANANEVAFRADLIDLSNDCRPNQPLCRGLLVCPGSPLMPITVRTGLSAIGGRCRPRGLPVAVPSRLCPGIQAPELSTTCDKSKRGSTSSINFEPNSRFMKLFVVISPT
jgi:hypothetical protein